MKANIRGFIRGMNPQKWRIVRSSGKSCINTWRTDQSMMGRVRRSSEGGRKVSGSLILVARKQHSINNFKAKTPSTPGLTGVSALPRRIANRAKLSWTSAVKDVWMWLRQSAGTSKRSKMTASIRCLPYITWTKIIPPRSLGAAWATPKKNIWNK